MANELSEPSAIRTHTVMGLSHVPLPVGLQVQEGKYMSTTYARLLRPGQQFRDGKKYTVTSVDVTVTRDPEAVLMDDNNEKICAFESQGDITLVRVHVEECRNPIVYNGEDRVELV